MQEKVCASGRCRRTSLARAMVLYGLLLLFTTGLLWPLLAGRSLYWGDLLLYFDPMLGLTRASLRAGRVPLWNPYVLCGQPLLGNPQMGVFYPLTALLPFVSVAAFLRIAGVLHLFLCGAFTYCFLCRWTARRTSALAGALIAMGSACLVGRLQFPPMVMTAAYFPLVLRCLDRWIDRPGPRTWMGVVIAVALTVLAAHAQLAYLILTCSAAYAMMRLWSRCRAGRFTGLSRSLNSSLRHSQALDKESGEKSGRGTRFAWSVLPLAVAAFVGLLLTSVQVYPALQLLRESPREQLTALQANRFVLEPVHLLTLIAPRLFGHPASADYWGGGNAWEPALFVGWLPLALIGMAIVQRGRERLVRFWAAVALLGIWLALGNAGGLYAVAFAIVPGIANFHDPARFLFLTTFAFAILTAVGMDAFESALRSRGPRFRPWILRPWIRSAGLLLIALPLGWTGQDWNPTTRTIEQTEPIERTRQPDMGRIYSPQREPTWDRYINYSDYGPTDARTLRALVATLVPNIGMRFGMEEASGYEPVPIQAATDMDGLARRALLRGEPNLSRLLRLMRVQTLRLPEGRRVFDPDLRRIPVGTGASRAWTRGDPPPHAWLVRHTRRVVGALRIQAALTAPDFDPEEVALVAGSSDSNGDLEWGGATGSEDPSRPVVLLGRSSTQIEMRADAGKHPAFLVYAATAYPGWKAMLDGKAVPLVRADGALMGLSVPPGNHVVRLNYLPDSYRIGLFLTLWTCGGLTSGAVAALIWRRK